MRHVLLIAAEFPPVAASGVQRMLKFVKYLPARGWVPHVVTGPGQPSLYHGLDLRQMDEIPPGVVVHRTRAGTTPGAFRQLNATPPGKALIRLLTFPDVYGFWMGPARRLACRVLERGRFDAVLSTDPVSAHVAATLAARRFSVPWICDIRDLWTDGFHYRPTSFLHRRVAAWIDRVLLRRADGLSVATEGFRDFLEDRYPFIRAKIRVVRNGFDESDFPPHDEPSPRKFTMVYSGEVYTQKAYPPPEGFRRFLEPLAPGPGGVFIRSTRPIVTALERALEVCPDMRNDFELVFVGSVADNQRAVISESPVRDLVRLTGHVSHGEAVHWIRRAHALLLMQDGVGSEIVVPAKVYEYMRAGKPILGLFRPGETPELLRRSGLGYTPGPTDVEAITADLVRLYRDARTGNAREPDREFILGLTRERATHELAGLLDEVVAASARGCPRREGGPA